MEEQAFERPLSSSQPVQTAKKRRSPLILLVIFILLVILIIFFIKQFGAKTKEVENASITPTPTEEFEWSTEETSTPEASPTEEPTDTPTPKPTLDPVDKETGLDRSELNIEVLNGSGEKLVGSKASEVLKSFGYHVVNVGNADNFDYQNVVIQIKEDKNKYLSLLKKDLGASYTIGSTLEDLSASVSADVRVIIGK